MTSIYIGYLFLNSISSIMEVPFLSFPCNVGLKNTFSMFKNTLNIERLFISNNNDIVMAQICI